MDKKSKILFAVFGLLIVASVAVTYWKIIIQKDYVVEAQTDCDPYAEKCFIWECDPTSTEEGEKCTGDPESDIWYFQVARRNAANIPLCDPETDETCDPWTCEEGEADCSTEFCTEDQLEAQYASGCVDPIAFVAENPIEEEECAEDDGECLAGEEEAVECEEGDTECEAAVSAEEEEVVCEEGDTECQAADEEESAESTTKETEGVSSDKATAPDNATNTEAESAAAGRETNDNPAELQL